MHFFYRQQHPQKSKTDNDSQPNFNMTSYCSQIISLNQLIIYNTPPTTKSFQSNLTLNSNENIIPEYETKILKDFPLKACNPLTPR